MIRKKANPSSVVVIVNIAEDIVINPLRANLYGLSFSFVSAVYHRKTPEKLLLVCNVFSPLFHSRYCRK
ncbi:MAG: hypothetical protein ACLRZ9_06965 [Eubacterium sp.]